MAICPYCKGPVINSKCTKCGAFTYIPTGRGQPPTIIRSPGKTAPAQGTAPSTPVNIMKLHEWKTHTRLKVKRRSGSLRRLDRALKDYEFNKSLIKLATVRARFNSWVAKKGGLDGNWMSKNNDRNHKKGVEMLSRQLNGEPVKTARAFMEPDLDNARLGILFFFSKLEFRINDFKLFLEAPSEVMGAGIDTFGLVKGSDPLSTAINEGLSTGKDITDYIKVGDNVVMATDLTNEGLKHTNTKPVDPKTRMSLTRIVLEFLEGIWNSLKNKFFNKQDIWGSVSEWVNQGWTILKSIALLLVEILLDKVAPFIKAGVDMVSGVGKIFKGLRNLVIAKWRGYGVKYLPGHPQTIVTALHLNMSRSMFEGFYDLIKGSANMAVDSIKLALGAASYGAATAVLGLAQNIAGIVLSVIELIAKFAFRIAEGVFIKIFCVQAKKHFTAKDDQCSIHRNHEKFNAWFRTAAILVPVIAALTINGLVCGGDAGRFLQLVNDDGSVVSQKEYNRWNKDLASLKEDGMKLIDDSGWHFHSSNPIVQTALKHKRHDTSSTREKAFNALFNTVDHVLGAA